MPERWRQRVGTVALGVGALAFAAFTVVAWFDRGDGLAALTDAAMFFVALGGLWAHRRFRAPWLAGIVGLLLYLDVLVVYGLRGQVLAYFWASSIPVALVLAAGLRVGIVLLAVMGVATVAMTWAVPPSVVPEGAGISAVASFLLAAIVACVYEAIRMRYDRELRRAMMTDELTGALRRRAFGDDVTTELARFERHGRQAALVLFDVDKFKEVNDTYGHAAGDRVLQEIATRVREAIRTTDDLYRLGGDEFAVLARDTGDEDDNGGRVADVARFAERVRAAASQVRTPCGKPVAVSLGTSIVRHGDTVESLLRRADEALYRDKAKRHALTQ